ncbi:uncharacterized protein LOC113855691 [Abrus precatorius]|uniref:Uncharacterized protein LOC113855691 n=1 Tax=Abrus precatorius TaxID=3816 RepID=A0A8B8KIN7_ABRPR|nr:uncharacterized protein LOC113855691 [Abrus precatorius]
MRHDEDRKNCTSIFPKLKEISIRGCDQLEYVIGPNHHEDDGRNLEFHMDFPALEELTLIRLSKMINICPRSYVVSLPSLKHFGLDTCPQYNSVTDLVMSLYSRQLHRTTNKDTREGEKRLLNLETLCISATGVESIFHIDEHQKIEQPLSTTLKILQLLNLAEMKRICVASKNSFTFQHLERLIIEGCAKLELIFTASISRCLPELKILHITECEELKELVEKNVENQKLSTQACFPKLAVLIIRQCNKLKRLVSVSSSASNDFPNLEILIVNGASELEELIGYEQGQGDGEMGRVEVKFPKLRAVIFRHLLRLCLEVETMQTIRHRIVYNCPNFSLTSTTSPEKLYKIASDLEGVQLIGFNILEIFYILLRGIEEVTADRLVDIDTEGTSGSMLPSSKIGEESKEEFPSKFSEIEPIDRPSGSPSAISQTISIELADGQSMSEHFLMNQQMPLNEIESKLEISEINETGVEEESTSDEIITSTDSESTRSQLGPLVTSRHKSNELPQMKHKDLATSENELPSSQLNEKEITIIGKDPTPMKSTIAAPLTSLSIEASAKECVPESSNLIDKEGEIVVVSIDNIVTQRNEVLEKEFIRRASISERPSIAASQTHSDLITPSPPDIPLPKPHSNSLQEIVEQSTQEDSKSEKTITSTERGVEEGASEDAKMATLSTHLKPTSSQPGPSVTPQRESYRYSEIRPSQTETLTNKESECHPINIQDFRYDGDDQISASVVTEDNLVVKVLADLEESLKMPMKDIACSETNSLRLLTALNFLSRLSLEHVTLSDGLKAIIESLHKEFPIILRSFKQAFATTNKFVVFEERVKSIKEELDHRKEVATTLACNISKTRNLMDEARQKEAMLKEQMNRLEEEIKDYEAELSSLEERENKFVEETIGYEKECDIMSNNMSQMAEDQRKARQELYEIDYKWSVLCSQFEHNRTTAKNPS